MADPSLRTAASGMIAQQTRVDVIANNLANVNTTAFKRSRAHFEDLLYQTIQGTQLVGELDEGSLPAIQVGRGVRLAATPRVDTQGSFEPTGRALDDITIKAIERSITRVNNCGLYCAFKTI